MPFLNFESPCYPLKTIKSFELLNKREERRNNVGKTVVIFPQIFRQTLGAIVILLGILQELKINGI